MVLPTHKKECKSASLTITAWKVSKYGVFSGPNTGKYGPGKTPYLDTFQTVWNNYLFGHGDPFLSKISPKKNLPFRFFHEYL